MYVKKSEKKTHNLIKLAGGRTTPFLPPDRSLSSHAPPEYK